MGPWAVAVPTPPSGSAWDQVGELADVIYNL
jgi:hypothetical protein